MMPICKYLWAVFFLFSLQLLSAEPNLQHSWIRTNAGGGGAFSMVAATKSGILLAASDISGVYRSVDQGKNWEALGANNGLLETGISSLGFHPTNGNIFYIGTYRGLYKTKNAGKSIYQVKLETIRQPDSIDPSKADGYIESIGMSLSQASTGYLAHYEDWNPELTFMKTSDEGETWKILHTQGLPKQSRVVKILVDHKNSNIVYALTGKARFGCSPAQLYKSVDGGLNWRRIAEDIGKGVGKNNQDESDILDFDLHPDDSNKFYISTFKAGSCADEDGNESEYTQGENADYTKYIKGNNNAGALYVTNDGGSSFSPLIPKDENGQAIKGITGIISVGNDNPDTIRVVDILHPYDWNDKAGTWESTDAGKTWNHTGLVANWDTAYSANQYYSFTPSFFGLSKTLTKDIFNSNNYYGSFGQWVWGSTDGGKHINNLSSTKQGNGSWSSTGVDNINGHALDVNDKNPNIIYIGGYDIGFWVSKDHGKSWSRSLPDYNKYPNYVWDLGTPPVETFLATHGAGSNVNTLLSDPEKPNIVWASFGRAQYEGQEPSDFGLFKSMDYGKNWKLLSNGLPKGKKSVRIYGLSIDPASPANKRTLFVTVNGDVYKSNDGGNLWKVVLPKAKSGGLKFTNIDHFNPQLIYAGGEGGLWRSENAGDSWEQIGGAFKTEMQGNHAIMRNDIIPTDNEIDYSSGKAIITLHAWEGVFDIKTDPSVANRLYVSAFGKGKGLYRSDDAGLTWKKLITDDVMRGISIAPQDSNILYATSSQNYYSGGQGNSLGILYSTDAGNTWLSANDGMAWNYGGMIEIETGEKPGIWAWSPGTGVQYAKIPSSLITDTDKDGLPDAWETSHGLDKNNPFDAQQDPDMDGLTNLQEYQHNTDPKNRDTDNDGASDGDEIKAGTNPLDAKSFPPPVQQIPTLSNWSTLLLILLLNLLAYYYKRPLSRHC
jgi:photosystem II stability/assembly factor-like uncharacterized protein